MNKYHVAPRGRRTVDGIVFDSKAEANRYLELRLLETAGEIKDLELQPSYSLLEPYVRPDGKKDRGIIYRADFRYLDLKTNRIIVEDVKGAVTDVYRLKKKLLLALYPDINFVEVKV